MASIPLSAFILVSPLGKKKRHIMQKGTERLIDASALPLPEGAAQAGHPVPVWQEGPWSLKLLHHYSC